MGASPFDACFANATTEGDRGPIRRSELALAEMASCLHGRRVPLLVAGMLLERCLVKGRSSTRYCSGSSSTLPIRSRCGSSRRRHCSLALGTPPRPPLIGLKQTQSML
ncbi:unnamed protein product [Musa banksii]